MPYLDTLDRSSLPELEETFKKTEQFLGFLPNDVLTMAHAPEATRAFMDFCISIYENATLPQGLLHLVGMMTSAASGCRYCTAHTANKASEDGVEPAKLANLWEFETHDAFSDAERAALNFAFKGGQSPSLVAAEDYARLRVFYSEGEIVELLLIICQFGFWNRWNDNAGTLLEDTPRNFAEANLPESKWTLGKHG